MFWVVTFNLDSFDKIYCIVIDTTWDMFVYILQSCYTEEYTKDGKKLYILGCKEKLVR